MRPILAGAVDLARRALLELEPSAVGAHLGVHAEDECAATHRFEATLPGYRGWQWAVVVAAAPDAEYATVSESALLPGPDALIAPEFVPWEQRIRPGDLAPGDLLAPPADDPRLAPGYTATGDPEVDDLAYEVGLGRSRVLSQEGRLEAAERWYGEYGPNTDMAKAAPANCGTCGFYLPLAGALHAAFGVCANVMGADGHVVHTEYGCGAHSDTPAPAGSGSPLYEAYDDAAVDLIPTDTLREGATTTEEPKQSETEEPSRSDGPAATDTPESAEQPQPGPQAADAPETTDEQPAAPETAAHDTAATVPVDTAVTAVQETSSDHVTDADSARETAPNTELGETLANTTDAAPRAGAVADTSDVVASTTAGGRPDALAEPESAAHDTASTDPVDAAAVPAQETSSDHVTDADSASETAPNTQLDEVPANTTGAAPQADAGAGTSSVVASTAPADAPASVSAAADAGGSAGEASTGTTGSAPQAGVVPGAVGADSSMSGAADAGSMDDAGAGGGVPTEVTGSAPQAGAASGVVSADTTTDRIADAGNVNSAGGGSISGESAEITGSAPQAGVDTGAGALAAAGSADHAEDAGVSDAITGSAPQAGGASDSADGDAAAAGASVSSGAAAVGREGSDAVSADITSGAESATATGGGSQRVGDPKNADGETGSDGLDISGQSVTSDVAGDAAAQGSAGSYPQLSPPEEADATDTSEVAPKVGADGEADQETVEPGNEIAAETADAATRDHAAEDIEPANEAEAGAAPDNGDQFGGRSTPGTSESD